MRADIPCDKSRGNRGLVWLVAAAFFMELLDSTVITTALPQMAQSFHSEPIHLAVGISAYMLALAVFIPLSGWMADRFGPRQVFGGALLIFTLASTLCSLSSSLWFFTGARVLQGFGGAMMVPVGRMVVLRATPKDKLMQAIATLTWPALGAPVLGPVLGGLITTHWGWRWIFLLNVPLGLLGFALTLWLVEGQSGGQRPFDKLGFLLSGLGCSALMLACDLSAQGPIDGLICAAALLGALALTWAVRHLRTTPTPLVDLESFRWQSFAAAMRGGSMFRISINSAPFIMPLMFQLSFGYDATSAGLMLLALFAGNICMKPATTPLLRKFGFRTMLLINGVLVALGFLMCLGLTAQTPKLLVMLLMFFTGLSRSMQFTALSTLSFSDISDERMSGASTLSSILVQMSSGLGVALAAITLKVASAWFPSGSQTMSLASFQTVLVVMTLVSLAGLPDLYRLPANAGSLVSGKQ